MSRIGKKPIEVPPKVKVNVDAEGTVTVQGPKGTLSWSLPKVVRARVKAAPFPLIATAKHAK